LRDRQRLTARVSPIEIIRDAHCVTRENAMKTETDDLRLTAREASRCSDARPAPSLLTVPEVADLLRTSEKAIYAMVERRRLPGVRRIGRRILFRRTELLEWLDHNCAPSSGG
jgi:excisionase family DNA binding protein